MWSRLPTQSRHNCVCVSECVSVPPVCAPHVCAPPVSVCMCACSSVIASTYLFNVTKHLLCVMDSHVQAECNLLRVPATRRTHPLCCELLTHRTVDGCEVLSESSLGFLGGVSSYLDRCSEHSRQLSVPRWEQFTCQRMTELSH